MASRAQIEYALRAAQAAGNTQDVAALQNALSEATGGASNLGPVTGTAPVQTAPAVAAAPTGPTRDQLSQAFYAAKQAGNEGDARKIIGYVQQHGMTIAPPSAAQADTGMQKINAQNVAAQPWYQTALQGVGKSFVDTGRGIGQLIGVESPQDVAESRRTDQALMDTTAGKLGNLAGYVAQSAPFMVGAGAIPALAGISGRAGLAGLAAAGGAQGFIAPHASTGEQVADTTVGALLGPAAKAIGGVTNAAVRGMATPEARQLIDAGVKLTPGQTIGGAARRIEDGLTSVPLIGDLIRNAQRRSVGTFNIAAMNQALAPIGATLPTGAVAGKDAISLGAQAASDAYDRALGGTTTLADQPLMTSLANRFNALPQRVQDKVGDVLSSRVFPAINESGGSLNGQQFKDTVSSVLADRRAMGRSTDPVERAASDSLGGVLDDLHGAFTRSNGVDAAASLKDADRAYRGFLQLQDATSHAGQGTDGVFTPAQFRAAVRRGDASKGKSAFARGNAFMQDLADTAGGVLPRTVPDSGTPYRMFVGAGSLGGVGSLANLAGLGTLAHATIPTAALMGTMAIPYTRAGGRVAQSLLAPQMGSVRTALSDLIDQYGMQAVFPGLVGTQRAFAPALAGPSIPPAQ